MNQYKLLQSVQAGPFSNSNKMIDFTIPEGMVIDLSQCFVQLRARLDTTDPHIHNMIVRNVNPALTPFNIDLIRNCSLTADKLGRLEDIRRVNILQHNLLEITKTSAEKASIIDSLYQPRENAYGMLISPFVEMHKDGVIPSVYVDARLAIPLSHLFSLGALTSIDTAKTGNLRIHLELDNVNYLEVVESKLFKNPIIDFEGAMVDVTVPSDVIVTVPELPYDTLEQSPYFVGQELRLSYTDDAEVPAPVVNQSVFVIGVSYSSVTKAITLTLNTSFPALPAGATMFTDITVTELSVDYDYDLVIETAEISVAQIMGVKDSTNVLEYLTFTTEEYSNGSKNLNKIFDVESNCVNAMLMFGGNSSNMISNNNFVKSYRMRIDNVDVYDRDIPVNTLNGCVAPGLPMPSPLHYDALNRTLLNAGLPLKSLKLNGCRFTKANANINDISVDNRYDEVTNNILICATPTPVTAISKKIQYNVETKDEEGAVIENVILYKQCVRSFNL
jgi:hypothetical protein